MKPFASDEERWQAVASRDPTAAGAFFYSVRTTGVYCRPVCPARLPRRDKVQFHLTCEQAERAGYRPCKRCRPNEQVLAGRRSNAIAEACHRLERSDAVLRLADLAGSVGMSIYHFHRQFKLQTGVTPKAYAAAHRAQRVREQLVRSETVTEAIYGVGFTSSSRFYESSTETLGMTPTAFRSGGLGMRIRFAHTSCWLGGVLVAATEKGVCAIFLGDDVEALVGDLRVRFPKAELVGGDGDFERLVAAVVALIDEPTAGIDLPLDIQGTAFQQRVWAALRAIPPGSTASYAEIAEKIGQPGSVRAVGQACGANPVAVVVPCHRVVRADGDLAGYHWGVDRKSKLLRREQKRR